jgi:gliding motility-associated-like protein
MTSRFLLSFLLFIANLCVKAQLCQGSLGDPLVYITFGSGSNPGAPLKAAATGYQYVSGDCPNDGFYTVRNSTSACFGNTWHSLSADHTGNGNGYFMLVNASIQPSAFYVDTVRGLCGSSTYEFAAWVTNVILPGSCNGNSNQPNLSFTIERTDGTVLQSYNSGNIAPTGAPLWKQYGFFFTTPPAGSDIVLRIVNNAPGGCGNDLALDDITFRPCGPQLTPSITGETSRMVNICEGSTRLFNFTTSISAGFSNPVFQWQQRFNNGPWFDITAANSSTYTASFMATAAVGNYEYRLSVAEAGNLGSAQCRISSVPLSIVINANPVVSVSNNGPICEGAAIMLTAGGGTQYLWAGPNNYTANTASPVINNASLGQAGTYNVTVSNSIFCNTTGSTIVQVNPAPVAVVPFTDTAVCFGNSVQLSASGGSSYEWLPAAGLSATAIAAPVASPSTLTRYIVKLSDTFGCSDTASIIVRVYNTALAHAGPDKTIIGGGSAILSGSIEGNYSSFNWSPITNLDNPLVLTPTSSPPSEIQYILTALSNNGCGVSTDTMYVKIYKDIYVPTAFSPNGDGINDTWNIPALEAYPDFELFIFNRYGELVFKNSRIKQAWDGSFKGHALPTGAYAFLLKLNVENKMFKGTLMLVH